MLIEIAGITLSPVIIAVLAILSMVAMGIGFLGKKKIIELSGNAAEWIEALGWANLVAAYLKAEKEAEEPDMKRDIAVSYILAIAKKYLGIDIPRSTANLVVEIVVDIIHHEGPETAAQLAGVNSLDEIQIDTDLPVIEQS